MDKQKLNEEEKPKTEMDEYWEKEEERMRKEKQDEEDLYGGSDLQWSDLIDYGE